MLESALVLSAFLFMIIGTLDIGRLMFMHQTLTERARKAVRWGASHAYSETAIRNVILFGTASPSEDANPLFGLGTTNVIVSRQEGIDEAPDRLRVQITGWTYRVLSPFIAGSILAPDIITSMTMENQ
jgi:hypothetical protein